MLSKNNYDAKKFRCCPYQAETGREYIYRQGPIIVNLPSDEQQKVDQQEVDRRVDVNTPNAQLPIENPNPTPPPAWRSD